MTLESDKHHFVQQDNTNNMDICGPNWNEGKNSANAYDNHQYIYSGSFLKQSPQPSSQYIPSLFNSRNGYGQSKRTTSETPEEPEKHQHMSEDEQKQFVLQKNGNYTLALSNYKKMVLSVFKGNVYCHIWDNRNKNHVSLNLDELGYMLKNKTIVQDIIDQLLTPNAEKNLPTFHLWCRKMVLDLSADKKMVLSLFKGNVYCHIWNNKNQKYVSLNRDELMYVLSNEADIEHITELLSEDTKQ